MRDGAPLRELELSAGMNENALPRLRDLASPRTDSRNFVTIPLQRLIHHALEALPETLASEDWLGLEDVRAGRCERIKCEKDSSAAKRGHTNTNELNP